MDEDSTLRRLLEQLADTAVVGLLAVVASVPVVTAGAALAAAGAALRDDDASGSPARRFGAALRPRLRAGSQVTLLALALGLVGAVDVLWALSAPLTVLRTLVLAAGALLLLAVASTSSVALAALADDGRRGGPTAAAGLRPLVQHAALHAAAAPHRALAVVCMAGAAGAVALVQPFTLPVVVGVLARSLRWAHPAGATRALCPTGTSATSA